MLLGAKCSDKGPPRRLVFLGREARRHRAGSPFLSTTFTYTRRAHPSSAAPCTSSTPSLSLLLPAPARTPRTRAPPHLAAAPERIRGAPLSLHVNLKRATLRDDAVAMDSSGHTDISDAPPASGSNDVFDDDLGLPAKPDALGKKFRPFISR